MNPNGYEFVNHESGNKLDNSINNLAWVSRSENAKHAYDAGLNRGRNLFTDETADRIRAVYIPGHPEFGQSALARKLGVSATTVLRACHGVSHKNGDVAAHGKFSLRKLSDEDAGVVRQSCVKGSAEFGIKALARRFGVTSGVISDIVEGKTYKDVK